MSESVRFIKQGISAMDAITASKGVAIDTRSTLEVCRLLLMVLLSNALRHSQSLIAVQLVS